MTPEEQQRQYAAYRAIIREKEKVKSEADAFINELESQGVDYKQAHTIEGLGDLVEMALKKLGITEERVKDFLKISECNCKKRKKFLNSILPNYFRSKQ